MINKSTIDFINRTKNKNILVVTNENLDTSLLKNPATILNEKEFLEHYPKNAYHYIIVWDCLYKNSPTGVYTLLAKMNHNLRDDGEILVTVLKNKAFTDESELNTKYFFWDSIRVKSIGWSKGLKPKSKLKQVKINEEKYLRFSYIPNTVN